MEHRKTNKKELEDLSIADMKFTVRFEGELGCFEEVDTGRGSRV